MSGVVRGAAPGVPTLEEMPLWGALRGWLQGGIWVVPKAWENSVSMVTRHESATWNLSPLVWSTDANPSLSSTLLQTEKGEGTRG